MNLGTVKRIMAYLKQGDYERDFNVVTIRHPSGELRMQYFPAPMLTVETSCRVIEEEKIGGQNAI